MEKKGFPESYDVSALLAFLTDIKAGKTTVSAPVYSHLTYDIVPAETITIDRPDILILEGLNVLQPRDLPKDGKAVPFVSDFFDFSIFLDADEESLRGWYVERFMHLKETRFRDPQSYFHAYAKISDAEAEKIADRTLGAHQSRQSPRKHPADPTARRSDPLQGVRPRDQVRRAQEALRWRCAPTFSPGTRATG